MAAIGFSCSSANAVVQYLQHRVTGFSRDGEDGLMVGLGDLRVLSQP